jgi:hypothetical protein
MSRDFQAGIAVGIWIGAVLVALMTAIYGPIGF